MKTKHDDGLEWLRRIRAEMAEEFSHDPRKMGEFYRRMLRQYKGRIYTREHDLIAVK
ncbi:MAG: hypothetical protein NTX50_15260 [Candidatus Sumerlaeota bacterium]|nr:hypothetical protein [Candidatus Sumerlaeota bacterium]